MTPTQAADELYIAAVNARLALADLTEDRTISTKMDLAITRIWDTLYTATRTYERATA